MKKSPLLKLNIIFTSFLEAFLKSVFFKNCLHLRRCSLIKRVKLTAEEMLLQHAFSEREVDVL